MKFLITKSGKKEINGICNLILFEGKKYTAKEFGELKGISFPVIYERIRKHLAGKTSYERLVLDPDSSKSTTRLWEIGGKMWTAKKLAELTGLSVSAARSRLISYEKGRSKISKLFEKVNENKKNNCKGSSSYEAGEALSARKKLNDIPGGGSWEKANLNPTKFYSGGGGNGCAKEHI